MTSEQIHAWLAQRVQDDAGCMVWQRACNGDGAPVASVDGQRARSVRRWLYAQLVGPVGSHKRVMTTCCTPACVAPGHLVALLPRQINAHLSAAGRFATPARRAANLRAGRATAIHSPEVAARARALRAQGLTLSQISKATGMSISIASRVCRGEAWRTEIPGATVFSWGGQP